jgi:hypothetical protein
MANPADGCRGATGSAGEFLLGVAGESHFGGFAFRKRVPLQLGQRLRVEPRVLSSCADPHLEQTYVPWPGFVPARATTHLPARWRRWLRKGEDSGPVVRPGLGCAGRAAGSANVTSTSRSSAPTLTSCSSQHTRRERIGCRTNRPAASVRTWAWNSPASSGSGHAPRRSARPATIVPVSLGISPLRRSLEPR